MVKRTCDYCIHEFLPASQDPCSECINLSTKPNFAEKPNLHKHQRCFNCLYVKFDLNTAFHCLHCIRKYDEEGYAIFSEWKAEVPRDCEKCVDLNCNDCLKGE